jgi:hypothetical protein
MDEYRTPKRLLENKMIGRRPRDRPAHDGLAKLR